MKREGDAVSVSPAHRLVDRRSTPDQAVTADQPTPARRTCRERAAPVTPPADRSRADRSLCILIGAETYPPDINGAARFSERLAIGLAGRGHRVHVVAPSATGSPDTVVSDGVSVHGIRSHRYFMRRDFPVCMPWDARAAVAALMEQVDPDVVHTQGHMVVGRYVVRAACRSGRPLVATNHLMPENLATYLPLPRALRALASWIAWKDLGHVLGHADAVTAPTPHAAQLLVRYAGLGNAVPVSCGIDAGQYRVAEPDDDAVPMVLFVGRLDVEKHVDELIRAVAALPASVPVELEIIGDGPRRTAWTALAAALGVADRVWFRGFVTEEELREAYARAAVFCIPSIAELQSLATLEAMASSTPVIAADAVALPHLVRAGRNGWLYTPGDIAGLTARLSTLLRDPALRRRMGQVSLDMVAEHAFDATLDTFENLYRDLARPAGGRIARIPLRSGRTDTG